MVERGHFLDYQVEDLKLDSMVRYHVALGRDPSDGDFSLRMGGQILRVSNQLGLTRALAEDIPETDIDLQDNGFYVARLAVNIFSVYLRERGTRSYVVIGRSTESPIPILDRKVSRRHVSLAYNPEQPGLPPGYDRITVRDLNSKNGTYITTQINDSE